MKEKEKILNFYFIIFQGNPLKNKIKYSIDNNKKKYNKNYEQFENFIIENGFINLMPKIKKALCTASFYLINFYKETVNLLSSLDIDKEETIFENILKQKNEKFNKLKNPNIENLYNATINIDKNKVEISIKK